MSEPRTEDRPPIDMTGAPNPAEPPGARTMVQITYALYAISFFVGLTAIIGVIIAHVKRGDYRGTLYGDHMTWLIRTFWISFLLGLIGGATTAFLIGFPILFLAAVWFIYRVVKGFLRVNEYKGFDDPKAFL